MVKLLRTACAAHARNVHRHPVMWAAAGAAVAAVFAGFLAKVQIDANPDVIWVPPGSDTARQEAYFNAAFDPFFRINQVILSLDEEVAATVDEYAPIVGVLTSRFMSAALQLQEAIISTRVGNGSTFSELCYKPIVGQGCLVETPLDYLLSDASLIQSATPSGTKTCQSPIRVPLQQSVVLGGVSCAGEIVTNYTVSVCGGCGYYAKALVITFLLQATDALTDKGAQWEQDVFLPLVSNFSFPGLRASYMAQRSIQDQIQIVSDQNQMVVIISYAIMFAYITVALGKFPHPVYTRALLGLQGIVIVALSVVAAIGIVSLAGMHITMIVNEVVPFLILALGVDNMFIITKAFDRVWRGPVQALRVHQMRSALLTDMSAVSDEGDVLYAMQFAMSDVGPSITSAAVCEILAFGVGATTDIPALKQFCIVAAIAVAFNYVLQMTWFLAAVSVDARRQEAHRVDLLPCVRRAPRTLPADASTMVAYTSAAAYVEDTTGTEKTSRIGCWDFIIRGQYVRRFFETYYSRFLFLTPVRVIVILGWLALLAASSYGVTQLKLGLEQQLALPTNSYLSTYFNDEAELLSTGPPLYVVLQNVNYTHPDTLGVSRNMVQSLAELDWVVPPVTNWINDFANWASPDAQALLRSFNNSFGCPVPLSQSTSTFAAQVSQFLYDVNIASACCQLYNFCGAQYSSDVKFLWGVPKNSSTAVQLHTAAGVVHLTPSPFAAAADSDGIDDGGCDMSFGFMSHDAVASAIAAQGEDMSSRVHLHSAGVASMPTEVHRSLAAGLSARLPHAVATVDLSSAGGAVPGSSVWATGLVRQINTLELIPCHVQTSRLRSTLGPLRNQSDFIGAMQHVQAAVKNLQTGMPQVDLAKFGIASTSPLENGLNGTFVYGYVGDNEHTTWLSSAPGGAAFPYSLTFVYYEQYNFIRGVAVSSVLLAIGTVYLASLVVTSWPVALTTSLLVACNTLDIIGFIWFLNPTAPDPFGQGPYGVDVNAVSVVNLIAAVGLSVEFGIHISAYFSGAAGSRLQRARAALVHMGSSVFTGITVTKFVGISVLAFAPSHLFRLYYFRMYIAIIIFGAFHGLVVLPVLLSIFGWSQRQEDTHEAPNAQRKQQLSEQQIDSDHMDLMSGPLLAAGPVY